MPGPETGTGSHARPLVLPAPAPQAAALTHYAAALGLGPGEAAEALIRAIAADASPPAPPNAFVVVHGSDPWRFGVAGRFDPEHAAGTAAALAQVGSHCARLRYVPFEAVLQAVSELADRLRQEVGARRLRRCRFDAIPRGGTLVLGLLASALELEPEQLRADGPEREPLVLVDDCSLSGARLGEYLAGSPAREVVFAHLYSHPRLREAVLARESRVRRCLSARDLEDHGPLLQGERYAGWQASWLERLDGRRYWIGLVDHLCLPWREVDSLVWNPVSRRVMRGFRIVPGSRCWSNRFQRGSLPIRRLDSGRAELRVPEEVLYADLGEEVVLSGGPPQHLHLLRGPAAEIWRCLLAWGEQEETLSRLMGEYEVDRNRLRGDVSRLVRELLSAGLLVRCAPDPARA